MKYIRVNKVDAEPMTFGEFKEKFPKSGGANIERDPADVGYVITYRKGEPNEYVSWCPKAEFEAVSRPVDGMTFGQAIDACRYKGAKIQRANWNGEGQFVRFEYTTAYEDGGRAYPDERTIWSFVAPENSFRVQEGQNPIASAVLCQPSYQSFAQVPQFQPENT